ncbi:hypothetical protein SK3146_06862 [Paenibacillus konkukensis]|uniref:Post-transcriptional regulator n=1 Tax=Paenibacillus konkukensis TaxID=2020716 RepID=A0ABY4S149_9BACL|nr:hypothetical protein [Paenibacillus konkukensis]UQZ87560.1 hypothetical protein SK3146_06862 [Paenibacillus konkukensis]
MKKLSEYERLTILSKFIETFANEEKVMQGHLIWNSLKKKPQRVTFEQAINIDEQKELIFYLERQKEMYSVNPCDVKSYFEKVEPWIETDAYLFDTTLTWMTAFTHEDVVLYQQV